MRQVRLNVVIGIVLPPVFSASTAVLHAGGQIELATRIKIPPADSR
jgi:hypothetical protein